MIEFAGKFLDFSHEANGLLAFNSIYKEYHQAVYSNILKMVKQPVWAEDILQDVFVALWENHSKIEQGRVVNWLFVVSYNKSVSLLKKVRKENLGLLHEFHEEQISHNWTPVNEDDFEWKLKIIEEAIQTLPHQKQTVFSKYRLEGKTIEEIAHELKISVNTVKDHLKVAKKMIKNHIQQKGLLISGSEIIVLLYLIAFK